MKKATALALAALLALCVPICASAVGDTFSVTQQPAAPLYLYNSLTSSILTYVPAGTIVSPVADSDGWLLINYLGVDGYLSPSSVTRDDTNKDGDDGVDRIEIRTEPNKTEYVDGEERFDPSGLGVTAILDNGGVINATGFEVFVPELTGPGIKKATVTWSRPGYSEMHSASFELRVLRAPVSSVTVLSLPSKTDYIEGQTLEPDGLSVRVDYTDGREEKIFDAAEIMSDKDFVFDPDVRDPLETGVGAVSFYYKYEDVAASFDLSVRAKKLIDLEIKREAAATTIFEGDTPSAAGLVLTARYDNGTSEDVTDYTVDFGKYKVDSINPVRVSYGGADVFYYLTVLPVVAGDTDLDGRLTAADARLALRAAVGLEMLSIKQQLRADADRDDHVTVRDARLILRASVGLEVI